MIRLSVIEGVWTVCLSRPNKANALTEKMLEEICSIADEAQKARAMILTGDGDVFSAGADFQAVKRGLATSSVWERASRAIEKLPCLSIAALNGTLAGGAFGMALACDLRIAVPTANFFYPVMKLGYLPQPSDPARMSALIGPARTKMILLAGQKLDANEALLYGLIDRICPHEALLDTAHSFTDGVRAASPNHGTSIKNMCEPI